MSQTAPKLAKIIFKNGAPAARLGKLMKATLILSLSLLALTSGIAQGRLVAIDSSMALVELNMTTGARTPITTVTGGPANITGLAYDRQLDILWGAANGNDSLYTINYTTGVATLVGAFNPGHDVTLPGLEFDDSTGALYMTSALAGTFYSVNKSTGQATLIGTHGITASTSMGYHINNDVMYAINTSTDSLYTLNRGTGAMTLIGAMAGTILPNSLAFNHDTNTMFMTDTSTDSLYTLNLATGVPTLVGSTSVGNLQGMVYINPVPEPGTVCALMLGIALLAARRRKR